MSSANPLQILHQPAFYFYIAASCSIQRQKRFEEALEAEVGLTPILHWHLMLTWCSFGAHLVFTWCSLGALHKIP
jgi:hypothetical protein